MLKKQPLFIVLFLFATLFVVFAYNADSAQKTNNTSWNFLPNDESCTQQITHQAYTLCYNENHEQPSWVAYVLTKQMCETNAVKRNDKFIADPMVKTGSAEHYDYKNSGYDRGHLCPAGDMNFSEETMKESFYMSNMSPQVHEFNAGIWERLENKVRKWAIKNNELIIITGPILSDGLTTIGQKNKISVPKYFYKIVCTNDTINPHALAFVIENKDWEKKSFFDFAVNIDSVEKITGINFFHALNDKTENELEKKVDITFWKN